MTRYVIVPIVEGHGEVQAVPILIQRWLQHRRFHLNFSQEATVHEVDIDPCSPDSRSHAQVKNLAALRGQGIHRDLAIGRLHRFLRGGSPRLSGVGGSHALAC